MTWRAPLTTQVEVLSNNYLDPLYDSVVEATQEAILNAQLAAETMVGRDGVTATRAGPRAPGRGAREVRPAEDRRVMLI